MEENEYALGEIDRRVGNIMRFGTVAALDAAKSMVQVDLGDLVTDWLPWMVSSAGQNRAWHAPDIGEQVVLLCPGDPSQGVVLGSVFQDAYPANGNNVKDWRLTFKDGSVVEFDRDSSALNVQINPAGSIRLNVGGTTLLLANGQATLTTPKLVVDSLESTFTGKVNVQGLLTYSAGLAGSGGSGAVMTGPMNVNGNVALTGTLTNNGKDVGSTLRVSGVQPGGGNSGNPV